MYTCHKISISNTIKYTTILALFGGEPPCGGSQMTIERAWLGDIDNDLVGVKTRITYIRWVQPFCGSLYFSKRVRLMLLLLYRITRQGAKVELMVLPYLPLKLIYHKRKPNKPAIYTC